MLNIPKLSDVEVAFPSNPPLPKMAAIPREFFSSSNEWNRISAALFFGGSAELRHQGITLKPKSGVDERAAYRAIKACLGSFEPKHEHKEAGVAYMLSEWFTIERDKAKKARA